MWAGEPCSSAGPSLLRLRAEQQEADNRDRGALGSRRRYPRPVRYPQIARPWVRPMHVRSRWRSCRALEVGKGNYPEHTAFGVA